MLYMILGTDAADSLPLRMAVRDAHIARVRELQDAGRLVLAGPNPAVDSDDPGAAGFTGSLIVAEFDTLEEARTWADADPYLANGAWTGAEVRPFKQTLP